MFHFHRIHGRSPYALSPLAQKRYVDEDFIQYLDLLGSDVLIGDQSKWSPRAKLNLRMLFFASEQLTRVLTLEHRISMSVCLLC